ncbi:RhoGAP-domain-containing protein [Meira miltonrushii]|uniref:RhoGAP-domain-containing protein n=1 Tax=Meira miltonrushii TaxID=1280837 RepID=A0A316V9F0_9BASI|nr:RhoGAP-domain-containing protein [Meira miltonrushii]PWN34217.1 RhoGAP-domain-containing protein [Meira miltonrushii]
MAAVASSSPRTGEFGFHKQAGAQDGILPLHYHAGGSEPVNASNEDGGAPLDGFPADEELPEPICGGCKKMIDEESADAGVIHFATQLWHVDCFRCAKCKNPVTTDRDDILLLSDGHPICGQCNYSCQICNLPIMEEAIMTGDESYHASCFVCRSCRTPIAELVFAKTSQGIYCMKCHNQRVARSRRHAEKKRAAAALAAAGGSGTSNASITGTPDLNKTPTTPSGQPRLPPKDDATSSTSNAAANLSPYMQSSSSTNLGRPSSAGNGSKRPVNAPTPSAQRTTERRRDGPGRPSTAEPFSNDLTASVGSSSGISPRMNAQKLAQQSTLAKLEGNKPDSASPLLASAFEQAASTEKLKQLAERNKASGDADASKGSDSHASEKDQSSLNGSRNHAHDSLDRSSPKSGLLSVNQQSTADSVDGKIPKSTSKDSRLSRAFSFYDPDIIGLMDSFGKFDSYEDFSLDNDPTTGKSNANRKLEEPASDSHSNTPDLNDKAMQNAHDAQKGDTKKSKEAKEDPSSSLSKLSETMRKSIQKAHDGQVNMDTNVVENMLDELEATRDRMKTLQRKYERIRRASQQAAQGFSSAREEYEHEVQARYDAEAEMLNLKRQLHLQATKLAGVATEKDKHETLQRKNTEVKTSIKSMEKDLAKLQAERDLALAEIDTLHSVGKQAPSNSSQEETAKRDLVARFEGIKEKYRREIDGLSAERDALLIEIEELRQSRDVFADETTALNAKNEELNGTLALLQRRVEHAQVSDQTGSSQPASMPSTARAVHGGFGFGFGGAKNGKGSVSANATPTISDSMMTSQQAGFIPDTTEHYAISAPIPVTKVEAAPRKFKWMKAPKLTTDSARSAGQHIVAALPGVSPPVPPKSANASSSFGMQQQQHKDQSSDAQSHNGSGEIVVKEHLFQPFNVLRPIRCFACQKNMWGQSELKCQFCGQACHVRCLQNLPISCNQPFSRSDEASADSQGPPVFGRKLSDHLQEADGGSRRVPLVVEKCVEAVELQGMDYEGIYRKSGGTSQLKIIQQLFEKGQQFNLNDQDRFNDISAITSVLKNYFRELPEPLLTFELHERFIECVESKNKDQAQKRSTMRDLVHLLPTEHFDTLHFLIDHLYRVRLRADDNRMSSRNLGVVFGPTLMRSHDPAQEFAHMGGKAMTIEFMIDNSDLFD